MTDQTRKIEDLLTRGTNGIAISPINSANQVEIINKAAAQTNLITHDADAAETNRLLYIGMGNYEAGLLCGQTLRKAMPDGGNVAADDGQVLPCMHIEIDAIGCDDAPEANDEAARLQDHGGRSVPGSCRSLRWRRQLPTRPDGAGQ